MAASLVIFLTYNNFMPIIRSLYSIITQKAILTEINLRHLKLIKELIISYNKEEVRFCNFVNRFEEIISNFDNPSQDWLKEMKALWVSLEEINAVLLDEKNITRRDFKAEILVIINKVLELVEKNHDQY